MGIGGRLHDKDAADHLCVPGAAQLGTFDAVFAGLGRLEPNRLVSARHDVVLDPERRDEEAVDDILRGQHEAHRLADRNVQGVDFALAAGVLDFPHPLLADDENLEVSRRRLVQPDVNLRAPHEEPEKGDQRRRGPADLENPALLGRIGARGAAAAAIAHAEPEHQPEHQDEDQRAQDELGDEQPVDDLGAERGRPRPERDPAHRCLSRAAAAGSRRRRRRAPPSPPHWRRRTPPRSAMCSGRAAGRRHGTTAGSESADLPF